MKIKLNGEEREAVTGQKLADFLTELNYDTGHCATAINGEFITRSLYSETTIQENDELEIVAPMQGG